MNAIKVAILQIFPSGIDLAANLSKGEAFCRRAVSVGGYIGLMGSEQVKRGARYPCNPRGESR